VYIFVLITFVSGQPSIPGPLPRFNSEKECHAFGDPLLQKLRERRDAELGAVLGRCVMLRDHVEGVAS
jgi:hypothetical protein